MLVGIVWENSLGNLLVTRLHFFGRARLFFCHWPWARLCAGKIWGFYGEKFVKFWGSRVRAGSGAWKLGTGRKRAES
jgi:hypothetical protein